ncbi:uroporphyrinogen-III synthase [Methylobacter tundripaludum]|uniref:Uroporphyrinogen-III synthase n=1 Tax=Methylobacter tundripaludum (strain ATCC BAA-1195 / DSM 17260 / SV96) TaxID=697282 RepID=G3IR06_METTV|nr:uroporphyrinogen-III synthase [Methylobacter tundripaludum]EGW23577.1 Uroporphyrinogen III synthase HEM4 [Methylobacter tundripaludum SV96]
MSKVLNGARVLVTRPEHQAENLSRLIEQRGGIAVRFPTLEIVSRDDDRIKSTLENLDGFQWVVFISANAVNFALKTNSGKIPRTKSVRFAAVGQATAQAMKMAGLPVDLVPEYGYNSEALLEMPQLQQVEGQNCLIVRGEGGREQLATTLRSRGAEVDYLEVYKRIIPRMDSSPVVELLAQHRLDVITVTSAEALQNLSLMLGEKNNKLLSLIPLVVVSDRIRCLAADMGFNRITVTDSPIDTAILETVITCVTGE